MKTESDMPIIKPVAQILHLVTVTHKTA